MTGDTAYVDRKFATQYLFGRGKSGASDHQKNRKQEKPQGALTPLLFSLPLGSKIYYGQVKVGDLLYLLRACDDNINQDTTCLITLF